MFLSPYKNLLTKNYNKTHKILQILSECKYLMFYSIVYTIVMFQFNLLLKYMKIYAVFLFPWNSVPVYCDEYFESNKIRNAYLD